MNESLQKNGRIEEKDGMHFYEQDVIMLDYLYTDDITIDFEVEFAMPGFGIVLSAYDKWAGKTKSAAKVLLAKFGTLEFSVYERVLGQQKLIHQESETLTPDKGIYKLRFQKSGTYLHVFNMTTGEPDLLGDCNIGDAYDRFQFGIYSSAGNTVRKMQIHDSRPSAWGTSLKNTNGGRLSFHQDGFAVENAENAIEVIREDIPLEPGRYFFSYKESGKDAHISAYVFDSREPKIKAKEKNLLRIDKKHYDDVPYFDIEKATHVTILFQVYSGSVYDIAIKMDPAQDYVSTNASTEERGGSYLQLNLDNLQTIKWTGTIDRVPYSAIDEKPKYDVLAYGGRSVNLDSGNINKGVSYDYEFHKSGGVWIFRIYKKGKEVHYSAYVAKENIAKVFNNVSGKIEHISIIDKNGVSRDVMYQRTIRKFVPTSIVSPIIVTGEDNLPFDLSSSYRILPDGHYIFTNWEREVFKPDRVLTLAKPLYGSTDIVLYGIKGDYDLEKLYEIPREELVNNIDALTDRFDEITSDNYEIRKDQVLVMTDNLDRSEYRIFVVDYLKNDSYAINENDMGEYELDISTEKENTNTYYDVSDSGEIHSYKLLDIDSPEDNDFIVLRRNEVIS